jgi:hypothetical protein
MNRYTGSKAAILALLLCVGVLGCRTLPPGMAQVDSPAQRYTLKSFSITAPTGENWYVQMQGENDILFYKMVDAASAHSIVAGVKTFVPSSVPKNRDELETLLKESFTKEQEKSERFRNAGLEVSSDNRFGEYSVMVHSISKDFSPRKLPSDAQYLLLNTYAYYVKPPSSDAFLYIWYSERSKSADSGSTLAKKADDFFNSFQMLPVRNAQ